MEKDDFLKLSNNTQPDKMHGHLQKQPQIFPCPARAAHAPVPCQSNTCEIPSSERRREVSLGKSSQKTPELSKP